MPFFSWLSNELYVLQVHNVDSQALFCRPPPFPRGWPSQSEQGFHIWQPMRECLIKRRMPFIILLLNELYCMSVCSSCKYTMWTVKLYSVAPSLSARWPSQSEQGFHIWQPMRESLIIRRMPFFSWLSNELYVLEVHNVDSEAFLPANQRRAFIFSSQWEKALY